MLKAIGSSSRTLAAGLSLQAVLIAIGAFVVGGLITLGLGAVIPAAIPLDLEVRRAVFTVARPHRHRADRQRDLVPPDRPHRPGHRRRRKLMPALELQDVRKTYGSGDTEVVALDHASLAVERRRDGRAHRSVGLGQDDPALDRGWTARADGRHGPGRAARDQRLRPGQLTRFRREFVGFVFQGANLVPFLTAKENLLVVADLAGNKGKAADRRALTLLDELGLGHRVDNLPGQLSGGERQRVAIGRALMNEPELVLFDEPTSALDSTLGEQVMELIRSEVKGRGTAAVVVTHDTRMTPYADRVVEISDGRLVA